MANTGNTQQQINYGLQPNDGLGDPLRTAFEKTDENFDNIWLAGPVGSNITIGNNTIQVNNTNGNLILQPNGIGIIQANAHIIPSANNVRDLGSADSAWRRAYINTLTTQNLEVPGDLVVGGNLTVEGDTIQIGNIVTDTLTIQLANTAANGTQANGAGITVGANDNIATVLYNSTQNKWVTNIGMSMPDIVVNSIRSDDSSFVSIQDGIFVDGSIDATGTVSAPYFVGNGSQLSGMYGNANVSTYLPIYSGNIGSGAGYLFGNGSQLTGMYGNANVADYLPTYTGNLAGSVLDIGNGSWVIQGNSIYAPSGGEWYSDPVTLDDFVTSAANGYINLQSLYADGNIASELHLEHGLAHIRVADAPFKEWTFRSTGTLEAPGNIDVDGNINANNTIFTQNLDISKTGNTWYWNGALMLTPAGGSWFSNPNVQEEYISSGEDGYLTLQSLGVGPTFQVESEINLEHGKVRIGVFDGSNKHWDFLEDGTLEVPGDIVPQANSTQSLGNATNQWANLWVANNTIYLGGVPIGVSAGNVLTVAGEPVLTNDSNTTISTTGNITADYFFGNGSQLTGMYGNTNVSAYLPTYTGNLSAGNVNFNNGSRVQTASNNINLQANVNGAVEIKSHGGNYTWAFDNYGWATLPESDAAYTPVANGSVLFAPTALTFKAGLANLTFDYIGDLSVPGNITTTGNITADYFFGNGSQLTGLNTSGIANGTSNIDIATADGNISVTAAGTYNWTFDDTGNMIFPPNGRIVMDNGDAVIGNQSDDFVISWDNEEIRLVSVQGSIEVQSNDDFRVQTGYDGGSGDYLYKWLFTNNNELVNITGSSAIVTEAGNLNLQSGRDTLSSGNVSITAINNGVAINTWQFTNDGVLTAPGNITTTGNVTAGNFLGAGSNVDIVAGSYDWTFANDGNLTLPGNTFAVNYANGTQVALGGNYGNSNVAAFLANFGSNTISTTGNITAGNISGNISVTGNVTGTSANVDIIAGSYQWSFNNTGNLVLPGNTFTVNYANGTAVTLGGAGTYGNANVADFLDSLGSNAIITTGNITGGYFIGNGSQLTGLPASYTDSNVSTFLAAFGSNSISTTGNVTANNFIGNIELTGNIQGTSANVELVAGSYTWTFNNAGNLVLPGNTFAVNYANGTAVQLGGAGTYGNANVADFLDSLGSNAIITTGNITAGNLITSGAATTGVNALLAGPTFTPLANTSAGFVANVNSYSQITFQNRSTGADATADYILTADNGSDTVNYGDFGIINSGYDINTPTNSLGNIVRAGDTYLYAQGNVSNTSQSGGNLILGTTTATKNVKIFAGGANNNALIANISNTGVAITGALSTTGNITANNITGSAANVTITANAYVWTFDNTGVATFPSVGGDEGGEINFGIPATNTTLTSPVKVDVYRDRIRFFDGSTKGAYIDLSQAATGVGTLLNNRVSTIAAANTAVTLNNIQARVGGSPTRLYVNTVSGNLTGAGTSQTMLSGSIAVASWINVPIGQGAANAFAMSGAISSNGDTVVLNLIDQGAGSGMWRITGMIANTSSNLYGVTIERLV